ncbi:hypothetical protein [Microbacterium sp.]|uniref:hypothetical protein n=1 Tax=Microbacterium sp. TaxID=51671 RepID=UPI0037C88504
MQDAIQLRETAHNSYDMPLIRAIDRRAREMGWDLDPGKAGRAAADIHQRSVDLLKNHKKLSQAWIEQVRSGAVSPEFAISNLGVDRATALDELTQLTGKLKTKAENAYEEALATYKAPTGTTEQQLLTEMRRTKIWDRLLREHAGSDDPHGSFLLNKLDNATPDEIAVILTEGPSWLASMGDRTSADAIVEKLRTLDPKINAAHRHMQAMTKLDTVNRHNIGRLTARLATLAPSYDEEPEGNELPLGYVNPTEVEL